MSAPVDEVPRKFGRSATFHRGDKIFNAVVTAVAFVSLAVLAGITIFLGSQMIPVIQQQGIGFLTTTQWDNTINPPVYGIWGMVYGSILIAVIALVIAVPTAILLSVFMVFLAPKRLSAALTNVVDLMAAIPSVIIGLWGVYIFQSVGADWAQLLNQYLGWIPIFAVNSDNFLGSPFIAGWILAIMMIPIVTAVTREVFARTPPELINASEALGGSLWSMLRCVALPFGRGGIVGGVMLGLGRALGETVAVFFVLKLVFDVNYFHVLDSGGGSVATLIVSKFGEASPDELTVLIAAGFVLFLATLIVNAIADLIVRRTGRLSS